MSNGSEQPERFQLPDPPPGLPLPVAAIPPPVPGRPLPPKDQAPGVCPPSAVQGPELLARVVTQIDLAGAVYVQMQGRLAVALAEALAEARGSVQAVALAVAKHVGAELQAARGAVDAISLAVWQWLACALGAEAECLGIVARIAGVMPAATPEPPTEAPGVPPEAPGEPVSVQEPAPAPEPVRADECPAPEVEVDSNVCVSDTGEEILWADAIGIDLGAVAAQANGGKLWPNFGGLDACKVLPGEWPGLKFSDALYASKLLGFRDLAGKETYPGWFLLSLGKTFDVRINPKDNVKPGGVYFVKPKPTGLFGQTRVAIFEGLSTFIRDGLDTIYGFVQSYLSSENCKAEAIALPVILRFFLSIIERWVGDGLPDVRRTLGYWINSQCPTDIPSVAESHQAFLSDVISTETWKCWVTANNSHFEPAAKIAESLRSRPNDNEVLSLFLRGHFTREEAAKRLRELGYLNTTEIADKFRLLEALPGVSDVIRFMVRDVDDAREIEALQLDAEFREKYRGQTETYGKAQGLSEELARRYWRAHWDTPSNTQSYEGLHRLRPDRVRQLWGAVMGKRPENFTPEDSQTADALAVHPDDVAKLLGYNDMVVPWRDRLIALSYRPLTRVDVKRAYFIGSLTREAVYESFLDLGYNTADAETLTKFTEREKERSLLNTRVIRKYIELSMPEVRVRARLEKQGHSRAAIDDALQQAGEFIDAETARICLRGERKKYFSGVYTDAQALDRIAKLGFELTDSQRILNRWRCEVKSSPKEVSAEKLCRFFELGIMGEEEFEDRLINIGYTLQQSTRIVLDCQTRISERRISDSQKIARQLALESEKSGRVRIKAIQDAVRAATGKQKATEELRDDLRRREKALLTATAKLGKRLKIDADQAAERIREQVVRLIRERRAPPDQATQAVLFAAANGPIGVEQDWPELVDSIYESLLAGAPELKNGVTAIPSGETENAT